MLRRCLYNVCVDGMVSKGFFEGSVGRLGSMLMENEGAYQGSVGSQLGKETMMFQSVM